jgi:hypothetical protein
MIAARHRGWIGYILAKPGLSRFVFTTSDNRPIVLVPSKQYRSNQLGLSTAI